MRASSRRQFAALEAVEESMNHDIRRKLKHITDILWAGGVTNPVTYIEQISYLIFLKLLDEEESDRELRARMLGAKAANGNGALLFPKQASRYRWSKWKFKSGNELRDYVRDEVFPYMASLVKDESTPWIDASSALRVRSGLRTTRGSRDDPRS